MSTTPNPESIIYHLTPADYYQSQPADQPYLPREYARDGFIHCTKGEERLLLVADTIYRRVPGDFLALVIDESRVTSPVKYENAGGILFPHIYGPLNRDAIVRVVSLGRREDGTFLPIGEPDPAAEQAVLTDAWLAQARVEQMLAESAELRAQTLERFAALERQIAALKAQAAGLPAPAIGEAPTTGQSKAAKEAEPATAATNQPALEARVDCLEDQVNKLQSEISDLKSRPAKRQARRTSASTKTRRPAARKSPPK